MAIKLLLLKSGEDIIADVQEMVVGEEETKRVVGYYLNRPSVVKLFKNQEDDVTKGMQISMYAWMPLAKDQTIPVIADWVVTMVDPVDNLINLYKEEIVNYGKSNKGDSTDESPSTDSGD